MATIRSTSYSNNEDIHLCHIYNDVSQNPIIGRNQTNDKFWSRVEAQYHACEPFKSNPRPKRSLESRISVIRKAVAKLRGCVNQIQNRNPSGASEQDVLDQAKEMLRLDKQYSRGFKFDHVWNIMKDVKKFSTIPTTPEYQRHSPYQSSSPGLGSSTGSPVGIDSLDLNNDEGITLTQRPIGVKKAKTNLQNEKHLDKLVKASKKMSKAIAQTNQSFVRRNELQTEKLAFDKREAEEKILFTDLTSISDPAVREYLTNEKQRILRKRAQESLADENGQGTQYQGSQYLPSEYQGTEGVQEQAGGSRNVAENFHMYVNDGNNWNL